MGACLAREFSDAYDRGRLPNSKGLLDQPLRWDLLFRTYSAERGRLQHEVMERARRGSRGSR